MSRRQSKTRPEVPITPPVEIDLMLLFSRPLSAGFGGGAHGVK